MGKLLNSSIFLSSFIPPRIWHSHWLTMATRHPPIVGKGCLLLLLMLLFIVGCHQTRCHRSCAIKRPSDGSIDIQTSTVLYINRRREWASFFYFDFFHAGVWPPNNMPHTFIYNTRATRHQMTRNQLAVFPVSFLDNWKTNPPSTNIYIHV